MKFSIHFLGCLVGRFKFRALYLSLPSLTDFSHVIKTQILFCRFWILFGSMCALRERSCSLEIEYVHDGGTTSCFTVSFTCDALWRDSSARETAGCVCVLCAHMHVYLIAASFSFALFFGCCDGRFAFTHAFLFHFSCVAIPKNGSHELLNAKQTIS